MTEQTYLTLTSGYKMPQMGLGVYLIPPGQETYNAVSQALKLGYRHIDTAHAYQNETSVGQAVKDSGIPREDIFITTKLWPTEYGETRTLQAIDKMLTRLDTDYIDLLLLHQPIGDYQGAYRAMEKAVEQGKVRSNGTLIESWYPLGHGDVTLLQEPILVKIADRLGKSTAQIILRWHLQKGYLVFPKTTNAQHMKENLDVFDFVLTEEDMLAIAGLENGNRYFNMSIEDREKQFMSYVPSDE